MVFHESQIIFMSGEGGRTKDRTPVVNFDRKSLITSKMCYRTRQSVITEDSLTRHTCSSFALRHEFFHYARLSHKPNMPETYKSHLLVVLIDIHVCCVTYISNLDGWLAMHRSITLIDFQLDAQNSYLFIYNTFIKILYMFRALPCSSSGGLRRNCMYAASGIVTLCR